MSAGWHTLDPLTVPLAGLQAVEASAGTGKTHTITSLYVRLIVESGLAPDSILVLTFTNAATAELRERLRGRLRLALESFESGVSADDFLAALAAVHPDRDAAARRLRGALGAFDLAAVHTIHGFCQRALAEHAFESAAAPDAELVTDEMPLLLEVAEDFWRARVQDAPAALVDALRAGGWSPTSLAAWARPHLARPWLDRRVPEEATDVEAADEARLAAFDACRVRWNADRDAVLKLLLEARGLSRNKYRLASIPGWGGEVDWFLGGGVPDPGGCKPFDRFTTSRLGESLNKGGVAPSHPFFDECERLASAQAGFQVALDIAFARLRGDLLDWCAAKIAARKRERRVRGYPDLLTDLDDALRAPGGDGLARALRERHAAALIDEFQDTDPVQLRIFRRIYHDGDRPVFLVGDPKQAIYGFRGADVFAYLDGRRAAGRTHALGDNWRSVPGLVTAVNAIFGQGPDPFAMPAIGFHPATAAPTVHAPLEVDGDREAPLRIWHAVREDPGKLAGKGVTGEAAARAVAGEIARLLRLGQAGRARIGERALEGGDVAVLVRKHAQARLVRDALFEVGVPSVEQSQESVFATAEASDLERLLAAVAEPARIPGVKAALASDLLGRDGVDIARLDDDMDALDDTLARFDGWHRAWRRGGFMAMFRVVLESEQVPARLLALRGGERRLTNVLHLAELVQRAEAGGHLGVEALVDWLAAARNGDGLAAEESELRLESDAHLVRLVTIHASKGLQYPLVFCPFLWDGRLGSGDARRDDVEWHEGDEEHRAVLALGPAVTDEGRRRAMREELAESVRLAYVALTRARHRCYVIWGAVNEAGTSPLARLLHPPPEATDPLDGVDLKSMNDEVLRADLERLAAANEAQILVESLPDHEPAPFVAARAAPEALAARAFRGRLRAARRVTSFTGLTAGHGADSPDHDAFAAPGPARQPVAPRAGSIHDFPRGARAGTCLHAIFERIDFRAPPADFAPVVATALAEHGFDGEWAPAVTSAIGRSLATPLAVAGDGGREVRLADVAPERRLVELEFHYPVARLESAALAELVDRYPLGGGALEAAGARPVAFEPVAGFLKGYIDLVFEAAGKWWIADYKSNWLGPDTDAYARDALAPVIARESYWLQYLVYTVALHRYLSLRVPGYDYDRCFGGVLYLFVRGLDPARGPSHGVWHDRPDRALVDGLDGLLGGRPGVRR